MEDPTEIGNCEECGQTEYLVRWHERLLCHDCAIKTTIPLVAPDPPSFPQHHIPMEPKDMITVARMWLIVGALVVLSVLGFNLSRIDIQAAHIQALERRFQERRVDLDHRLDVIEQKVDRLLEGQKPRSAQP